ncbi:MAG: hypothetical protein M0P32_05845, partial [Bacteroidales bacterium]|nr:hypothetical protein [Bacteroidales bacterium]
MANKQTNKNKSNFKNPIKGKPKFTFNIYWIYIAVFIFLGIMFFTDNGDSIINREIEWGKLQQVLLKKDYSKIIVVNKDFAEVYIKPDAIKKDSLYKDLNPKSGFLGKEANTKEGFYVYKFGDFQYFRDQI